MIARNEPIVFLVDDDDAARKGLQALIGSIGLQVKAFASAQEFLEVCQLDAFGCLLLDVRMPGMSGMKLQEELNRRGFSLPVIFITGHADVPMAVDAFLKGAFDFMEKPIRGQALLERIHGAIEKHRRCCDQRTRMRQTEARKALLTDREQEILKRVQLGQSVKSIAQEFGLSRKTIDAHMTSIREKMGVESTSQLIMLLCESGLLQPSFATA